MYDQFISVVAVVFIVVDGGDGERQQRQRWKSSRASIMKFDDHTDQIFENYCENLYKVVLLLIISYTDIH